jgi:outer membrane protein assembly factor BamB
MVVAAGAAGSRWFVRGVRVLSAPTNSAENNWPQFRGPTGDGHANARHLPLTWSETENLVWKTPIHDLGWSSPVVWKDQIWVTTATEDGQQLFAVGVDRDSGKIVHDVKVFDPDKTEHVASVNSYASPTPAIEAGRLYAHYGTYGTACVDTAKGAVVWARRDLTCDHHEGPGSSPILYEDRLIFNVDGRDVQYVVALDKATGKTVWKTNRSIDFSQFPANCRKAFCTPIVIEAAGRVQLFSPGAKAMIAYDPQTGEELWKARYNGWSVTPRPVFGHGLVFSITDYERPELWAVRADGRGDVTDTHVAWKITKEMPATSSLLLVDDLLYLVNDQGFGLCVEATTGKVLWRERLKGKHSASPTYGAGRIYLFSEKGVATVLQPGREFKILAENQFPERQMATPAVTGEALIVRTRSHLYRVEDKGAH